MQKSIPGIIEEIATSRKRPDKVVLLRKYDSMALRMYLGMALDTRVEWLLEKGPVEFDRSSIIVDQDHVLYNSVSKMYMFLKTPNPIFGEKQNHDLKPERRKQLFVQLLEAVPPKDAEFLMLIKDKKLPFKGITPQLCNEAFGTRMPTGEKEKEETANG